MKGRADDPMLPFSVSTGLWEWGSFSSLGLPDTAIYWYVMLIHVVPAVAEEASGPTYSIKRLCSELSRQEKLNLVTLEFAPFENAPSFLRQFPVGFGPRRLGRSPLMLRWLTEQARAGNVDIIHNHSLWMMPNVYPGWVARRFNVPLVVSPRGTLSHVAFYTGSPAKRIFWPVLQKPALEPVTAFHATAMSEYEDIRRMGFRQPVAVVPNGVDVHEFGPKSAATSRILLFLGRIHKIKGLDMLLPAWQAVQNRFPDWMLRVAGPDNGGYLHEIKSLAERLHLKRIEFVGPVYGEAKWLMYRNADLFVLPTYSENFGMSVAESLASGTPAVVTKGAPWHGLGIHNAGQWIDIGVDPLVASLEEHMGRSPSDLAAMGNRGREWVLRDFSWERVGEQMRETYQWLSNNGPQPDHVLDS